MVGVTGSIPVAPTIQSSDLLIHGDLEELPAIGGLFCIEFPVGGLRRGRNSLKGRRSPREESRILALGCDDLRVSLTIRRPRAGLLALVCLSRGVSRLIETQPFKLARPLGWRIAEAGNADTARQPAFDSGVDECRSDERHRDREIDVTDTAFVTRGNLLSRLGYSRDDLVQPFSAPRNRFDQGGSSLGFDGAYLAP